MKVIFVSPWGSARCGIRSYTRFLVGELRRLVDELWVVPHYRYAQPSRDYARWLAGRVNALKPDITHLQHEYGIWNPYDPSVFVEFLRLVRGRKVVTMHSTGFPVESAVSGLVDAVVVHNRHMLSVFQGDKEKAFIIPHGCRPISISRGAARRRLGIKPDTYLVGVFGFIDYRKGHDIALEAYKRLRAGGVRAEMVFVGGWHSDRGNPYMAEVLRRAGELGVRATGYVSDEEFELWLGAVDVVLHPARAVSESGIVSLALGAGKPVVAADHPALQDKPVVRYRNTEGLVKALEELRDPGKREEYAGRARSYAEQNSWRKVAEKHVELYRKICS